MQHSFILKDLLATENLAKLIARVIVPEFVVTLNGELGAGKTTLVRSALLALGVTGSVKSPTFTIVEPYQVNNLNIYHFDLYRFNDPEEWFYSGFDEYFGNNSICFIEWAEKAVGLIPVIDWQIKLKVLSSLDQNVDSKLRVYNHRVSVENDSEIVGNEKVCSKVDMKVKVNEAVRIIEIESKSEKGGKCLIQLMKLAAKSFS